MACFRSEIACRYSGLHCRTDPRVAVAVRSAIRRAANQLADFPHAGRAGLIPETRELIVNKHPYIIVYRVTGTTVEILRVHHDATNWMGTH